MRNFLERRLGKEIEIQCEGMMVKGKVDKIEGNVLVLTKDEETCYLNIEKIIDQVNCTCNHAEENKRGNHRQHFTGL